MNELPESGTILATSASITEALALMNELLRKKLQTLRQANKSASFASLWQTICRENPELIPDDESLSLTQDATEPTPSPAAKPFDEELAQVARSILAEMNPTQLIQASLDGTLAELNKQASGDG